VVLDQLVDVSPVGVADRDERVQHILDSRCGSDGVQQALRCGSAHLTFTALVVASGRSCSLSDWSRDRRAAAAAVILPGAAKSQSTA
jgi:hypothetical protein